MNEILQDQTDLSDTGGWRPHGYQTTMSSFYILKQAYLLDVTTFMNCLEAVGMEPVRWLAREQLRKEGVAI